VTHSGEHTGDHLAVDVSQALVSVAEAIGQALVLDAEEVEHRRVQVVNLALLSTA
jgi:hypothetical protein